MFYVLRFAIGSSHYFYRDTDAGEFHTLEDAENGLVDYLTSKVSDSFDTTNVAEFKHVGTRAYGLSDTERECYELTYANGFASAFAIGGEPTQEPRAIEWSEIMDILLSENARISNDYLQAKPDHYGYRFDAASEVVRTIHTKLTALLATSQERDENGPITGD